FGILPGPVYAAGLQSNAIVLLGFKTADLLLPLGNNSQGRRLHPAAGELGVVLAGESSGSVYAHQPVRLGSGLGRPVQIIVVPAVLQMGKALPDGLIGHRGNPQPPDGLAAAGFFQDPAGYQFSLPARVCGDDDLPYVFPEKL